LIFYYYPFLSSRAAPILLSGTVENPSKVGRTPWSAAGPLAGLPRVFIAFGGPKGHADRLATVGNLRPIVKIGQPLSPENLPTSPVAVCGNRNLRFLWGGQSWLPPAFSRRFRGAKKLEAAERRLHGKIARPTTHLWTLPHVD